MQHRTAHFSTPQLPLPGVDASRSRASHTRLRAIALPAEHGGWALLLEPAAIGLILAPSAAGLCITIGTLAFFVARQPLTIVWLNRRPASSRSPLAKRFVALYIASGVTSLLLAFAVTSHSFVAPLIIATPLALAQIAHDVLGRRRVLAAEIAGVVAISSVAPAIALAGGWTLAPAMALWAIVVARAVPAIVYVRACLARVHRRPASLLPVLTTHAIGIIAVTGLAFGGLAPQLAVAAAIILFLRAVTGFVCAPSVTAKQIGISEVAFGVVTVLAVVLGTAYAV